MTINLNSPWARWTIGMSLLFFYQTQHSSVFTPMSVVATVLLAAAVGGLAWSGPTKEEEE